MTAKKDRPDPRRGNLPEGYEFEFPVKPMETQEEAYSRILAQGEAAARLLRDPDFNAAYQEILEDQLKTLVESKPAQQELREDCYFRVRGVQEMAYKLNGWVNLAERLKADFAKQEKAE